MRILIMHLPEFLKYAFVRILKYTFMRILYCAFVRILLMRLSEFLKYTFVRTEDEENSGSQCHVCLLARVENFALLHDECLHGRFCQMCAKKILDLKARCPICREDIKEFYKSSSDILHVRSSDALLIFDIL